MRFSSSRKGFGIAELVVVLAIIGLIIAVVMVNVSNVRKQARNKERIAALDQLALALRLYKDANGVYPPPGCSVVPGSKWTSPGPGSATWYQECETYISGLVPDYLPALPKDPLSSIENGESRGFLYTTNGARTEFKILAHFGAEVASNLQLGTDHARCPASCATCGDAVTTHSGYTYGIYSSGLACN
jgi:type II secretory pathway pseudopilin PulG